MYMFIYPLNLAMLLEAKSICSLHIIIHTGGKHIPFVYGVTNVLKSYKRLYIKNVQNYYPSRFAVVYERVNTPKMIKT